MSRRFLGIDVGAETVKIAEVREGLGGLEAGRRIRAEHRKDPGAVLPDLLRSLEWSSVDGAAATGRLSRLLNLRRIPVKNAQLVGLEHLFPGLGPVTLVSIGSRGFSVLEVREAGNSVFRENSRCSQGTGNFLRQLVERFGLTVEQASELAAGVEEPASLSGRCPVILKTDLTHLANRGESRERILAGLFDAICENVQVLIKPRLSPPRVLLAGGVAKAPRIRENFRRFLSRHGARLLDPRADGPDPAFLEAFGAAVEAARRPGSVPDLEGLLAPRHDQSFERIPPLREALPRVRRIPRPPARPSQTPRSLFIGFDMGSTGSKAVALTLDSAEPVWESYRATGGDPVGAAQSLLRCFLDESRARHRVFAFGATGSGREIVGSLLASCYGPERVFVLNEIAAHAEGARHYDPEVDTIFEIGGQDAKYARLGDGQVYDAAMNEACSAGTGSFIEEQGRKFARVGDVVQMGELALGADHGVSLGQHCSVFMAEIIDAAVSAGESQEAILAGIYDSVTRNYLNRVKGSRSVGRKIFCQGMPFSSDALAASVARQTGRDIVIPPGPGTIGALGICLLAKKELRVDRLAEPLDSALFLGARVVRKDTFACGSTRGCGGAGNKCRIDRLTTQVAGHRRQFLWGGNCSLYDRGGGKHKLPDRSPDPFRERRELIEALVADLVRKPRGRPVVAMTDEFVLKGLFPFFATFVDALGFDLIVHPGGNQKRLKRGIEESNVPYCAPLQLYSGIVSELLERRPDYLLLPMLRDLPRIREERTSTTCPLSQASADLLRFNLRDNGRTTLLRPVLDMGPGNLASRLFLASCRKLAESLGAGLGWQAAFARARAAQEEFESRCRQFGRQALGFCRAKNLVPVVVLGRAYTIHNTVLNSNVPDLLREQGAVAIPVDCYPVSEEIPVLPDIYWGYSQTNLRAARQIRRTPGLYSVFCSNYSCGPDSFNLHFYAHTMEGKPFAIIETDGHTGDAGTKTRVEAFLHCVQTDRRTGVRSVAVEETRLPAIEMDHSSLGEVRDRGELLLIPRMGPTAAIVAAALRAEGIRSEALPVPDRDSLRLGRKFTSGKECVPMTVTLGSVLQRIEAGDDERRYAVLMPTACGPCRFGVYGLLYRVVFEKLGLRDRVRIVSPPDSDYFEGLPGGFALKAWAAIVAADLLLGMLHDVRPVEKREGAARDIYEHYFQALQEMQEARPAPPVGPAVAEVMGDLLGVKPLLARAAAEFAMAKDFRRRVPTVAVVGEIYVRCDPFTNDFVIDRLERRGLRCRLAPVSEWLEYSDWLNYKKIHEGRHEQPGHWLSSRLTSAFQHTILERLYRVVQEHLGWPARPRVVDALRAASPYLTWDLHGEAVLTLGAPIHEHERGDIAGVVSAGPLECMPSKAAEAQFFHVAEQRGLTSLCLSVNGDPVDPELLDGFAYEVRKKFEQADEAVRPSPGAGLPSRRGRFALLEDLVVRPFKTLVPRIPFYVFLPRSALEKRYGEFAPPPTVLPPGQRARDPSGRYRERPGEK